MQVEVEGVFLSVTRMRKKGWKLYDLNFKEYFVSRDVVFHEGVFPFADKMEIVTPVSIPTMDNVVDSADDEVATKGVKMIPLQPKGVFRMKYQMALRNANPLLPRQWMNL